MNHIRFLESAGGVWSSWVPGLELGSSRWAPACAAPRVRLGDCYAISPENNTGKQRKLCPLFIGYSTKSLQHLWDSSVLKRVPLLVPQWPTLVHFPTYIFAHVNWRDPTMCLMSQLQCRELGKSGFPTIPLLDNEELVNACSEIKCPTTLSSKCIYITRFITFNCVMSVVLHRIMSRVSSTRTVKCDR